MEHSRARLTNKLLLVCRIVEVSRRDLHHQKVTDTNLRVRGPIHVVSSLELQWWTACAESLRQISAAHSSSEAAETIGRVNRLISAWPQDDTLPAEGYDGLKPIYKKLTSGLKEIKESADRDVK